MSSNIRLTRICQHCGKEFTAKTTVTKTCSDDCAKRLYKVKQKEKKIEASNQETKVITKKPIEDLKTKKFLTIDQAGQLLEMSRRTIYRLHDRGQLHIHKIGGSSRILSSDIDKLFILPEPATPPKAKQYEISECYTISEIQDKFRISEKALHDLIKRNSIPKFKQGRYAYVPKEVIEKFLNSNQIESSKG